MRRKQSKFARLLQECVSELEERVVYEGLRFLQEKPRPNRQSAPPDEILRAIYVGISALNIAANTLRGRARRIESEMLKPSRK
jgi:hypothetical protein